MNVAPYGLGLTVDGMMAAREGRAEEYIGTFLAVGALDLSTDGWTAPRPAGSCAEAEAAVAADEIAQGGAAVEMMEAPPAPSAVPPGAGPDGMLTQPEAPYGIPLIVQVEIPLQGRLAGCAPA